MTTTEHLLITAAEECAEIAQAISKALRFGLDDAHPKTGNVPNRELIAREYEDLLGTMNMLLKRGIIRPPKTIALLTKRARVHEFLDYAKRVGTISDPAPPAPDPDLALDRPSDSVNSVSQTSVNSV